MRFIANAVYYSTEQVTKRWREIWGMIEESKRFKSIVSNGPGTNAYLRDSPGIFRLASKPALTASSVVNVWVDVMAGGENGPLHEERQGLNGAGGV